MLINVSYKNMLKNSFSAKDKFATNSMGRKVNSTQS